jgi:biotin carboxyl carrier protein
MENYLIFVNNKESPVHKKDLALLDMVKTSNSHFHLLQNNKGYELNLLKADYLKKTLRISVNGNVYNIEIKDEFDQQVQKMGLLAVPSQKVNSIKAPMPGLIVEIMVKEGQEVSEGTPMLVLSAMKMENVILSQGDGIIKSVTIKKDDTVEKGQLIIEME